MNETKVKNIFLSNFDKNPTPNENPDTIYVIEEFDFHETKVGFLRVKTQHLEYWIWLKLL